MLLTQLSSSILKRNFLVGFLAWLLLWESCSRQPVQWVKKSSPNFKGTQLSSVFTQKLQYRRPFRNHTGHRTCWETWTDSAASILETVAASTNLCRAGFQAILPSESFLDSCVLKAFSLRSVRKKWKGEFGSKHRITKWHSYPVLVCDDVVLQEWERARVTNNISMALLWDFRLTEHSHRNLNLLNIIRANIPSGEKQVLCYFEINISKFQMWNEKLFMEF